ncbi:MAG: phosphoribosyltransferase [Candidatus Melainabacteria bacterium]|nr:MAG: phosphoribosyltransferase [Candidatus Melainabacteria bacterium]
MDEKAILGILHDVGAIITNTHVVFTSGRHSNTYVNKDALYMHPTRTAQLCQIMASKYDADQVDVVAGPTIGGVILSQWVAYHLSASRLSGETLSIYVEKEGERTEKTFIVERGYDIKVPNKNIVVVEDVLMTGGSAAKVIETLRALGGNVLGLSALCNRGKVTPAAVGGVPIHALTNLAFESWEEEQCPLCASKVPINTNVGKGKQFLAGSRAKAAS